MGILLFALSMAALALMSTTRESRAQAKEEYAYMTKHFNRAGLFACVLLASFFF